MHYLNRPCYTGSGRQRAETAVRAERPSKIEAPESTAVSLQGDSEEQELADDLEELVITPYSTDNTLGIATAVFTSDLIYLINMLRSEYYLSPIL